MPQINTLSTLTDDNPIKNIEDQIDKFEKYFIVISELIDDLLKNKEEPSKEKEISMSSYFNKSKSLSPQKQNKRSMSFRISNINSQANSKNNEDDQFFNEKHQNRKIKGFGNFRNKYKKNILFSEFIHKMLILIK